MCPIKGEITVLSQLNKRYPSRWGQVGVYSETQSKEELDNEVKRLLGKKGYDALHEKTVSPQSDSARREFAAFLAKKLAKFPQAENINEATILVEDFLGPKGMEKYQKALEEERNSKEFRNAVFLASFKHYPGAKWESAKIVHIGGPSGSGKSYACDAVLKQLSTENTKEGESQTGNDVVIVDGGIDREVSQMRSILLGAILSKGYRGGENLQSVSKKTAIKSFIQKAALASENNLSLVIPDTFANPKHMQKFAQFIKYGKDQMFVSVEADRVQTAVSGHARAWHRGKMPYGEDKLKFNVKHPIESKKYESEYFKAGDTLSKAAVYLFNNLIGGKVFEFKNDVLHLKSDKNAPLGYRVCTEADVDYDIRTTRRVYDAWLNHSHQFPDVRFSLPEWMKTLYFVKNPASQKWEPCYLEEYNRAKPNNRLALPRYQYILWQESDSVDDLATWADLKAKEFGPQIVEKSPRKLSESTLRRRPGTGDENSSPLTRPRAKTTLRKESMRYFQNIRERAFSQTKLVTVPESSLKKLAEQLANEKMLKKYRIKNVDVTQLETASSQLKVDMFCNDDKNNTKKVYLEKANMQGGIKYSMEKLDEEKQNIKMIKQIIQLAVDNAKPGAEIVIHPSQNQEIVKRVLEEALRKKFSNQFVLENNRYRILS